MNALLLLSYYDGIYALPLGSCTDYWDILELETKAGRTLETDQSQLVYILHVLSIQTM